MPPILRAVLSDRILLVLLVALLVQSYRVADIYGLSSTQQAMPAQLPTFKDIVEQLSQGHAIDIPLGDGTSATFEAPLGKDGKPIDIRKLFEEGGKIIEQSYANAESQYGAEDPRTVKARNGLAAVLLYRGEKDRAVRLLRQNYDIAIRAQDMAAEQRLDILLVSAKQLRAFGNDESNDLLARLVPVARSQARSAPDQAARILNAVASTHLEAGNLDAALAHFEEAQRLSLDRNKHKLTMIETGLGLTAVWYRSGAPLLARDEARRQLANVASLYDEELLPTRKIYLGILRQIFEKLGDSEYVAITEGLQADRS